LIDNDDDFYPEDKPVTVELHELKEPTEEEINKNESLTLTLSLLYGIATLLSWNAILSTTSFFEALAPSYAIGFIMSACFFSFYMVISFLIIPIGWRISFTTRVHVNLLINALLFFSWPFILTNVSAAGNE